MKELAILVDALMQSLTYSPTRKGQLYFKLSPHDKIFFKARKLHKYISKEIKKQDQTGPLSYLQHIHMHICIHIMSFIISDGKNCLLL